MSPKLATERQKLLAKIKAGQSNGQNSGQSACISKNLYEQPPQSNWFLIQLFYNISHLYLTYMSKIVIGQFIISSFDYYMTKFEKTLDFCIPKEDTDDVSHNHPKTAKDTKHPMIWFLFLPALIGLRFVFFWASVFSIVLGKGEVTAKEMQLKVSDFRRYYRSVRYYAVKQLSEDEFKERETRKMGSAIWRFIYFIDESIFMRKSPVFCDDEMHEKHIVPGEQTDNRFRLRNGRNIKKSSLNEIDGDSSDEGLDTFEKLDKYSKLKDSPSVDPDYKPGDDLSSEDKSEDTSDGELDSEEEKTESQKKLNGGENGHQSTNEPVNANGFSSDVDARQKSKKETGLSLDQQQLAELENQLVMKIMKHFKTNYNYSPGSGANVDDVFYSPIGSPPEKGYTSDSEVPTINNGDGSSNNQQNPEVSSSQEKSESAGQSQENNQV